MEEVPSRPLSNGAATASLVLGIVGLCVNPLALLAVVFGHVALGKIKKAAGPMEGRGLAVAGLVLGYLGVLFGALVIAALVGGFLGDRRSAKEAETLFPIAEVSLPTLPTLGTPVRTIDGTEFHVVSTEGSEPGQEMDFCVLLPEGAISGEPRGCVLVASAGSNLLSGTLVGPPDYLDETAPYAKEGLVVVAYSIDGFVENSDDEEEATAGYLAFRSAAAGVVNTRNAFALARSLPMVDADRIFLAGHSSAGTLSLLAAAHLPELAGAVAYAPVVDVEAMFREPDGSTFYSLLYPGVGHFVRRSSPRTHADRIEIPVFFFYADDDERVEAEEGRELVRSLTDRGIDASLRKVSSGGHYYSMIEQGIPAGIEWIKNR